jgi:hypothetical protein
VAAVGDDGGHELTLRVLPGADSDVAELATLARQLRSQLLRLAVAAVDGVDAGEGSAADAKGPAAIAGWLAVRLGPAGLRAVLNRIADWAARNDRAVEVTLDGDTLRLARATSPQQQQILDNFLSRHRSGG